MADKIKIISIERSYNYINIFLDTGEKILLPNELSKIHTIDVGKQIDRVEYLQLKEECSEYNCKLKAINYIAIKARTEFEIESYLSKKGFSKNIINSVVLELKQKGFINDSDYSIEYINIKRKRKVVGNNYLRNKLIVKGISKEVINKALKETCKEESQIDEIYKLSVKKLDSLKKKKNKFNKLYNFLLQRGFDFESIKIVIERIQNEKID